MVNARFTALCILACTAYAAQWKNASSGLSDSPATLNTLIADSAGTTLYVRAGGNQLFHSTDGGSSWRLLNIAGITAVAIDPSSPTTVYAAGPKGVRKSGDGGEHWELSGLRDATVGALAVHPATPAVVYAAAAGGRIYRSDDAGETWMAFDVNAAFDVPGQSLSIRLDPHDPQIVYASVGGLSTGLFKSTDGGAHWSSIQPAPFGILLGIDPLNPTVLYALRVGSGFSKSVDGGISWTKVPFDKTVVAFDIDTNNSTLYVSVSGPNLTNPGIYKSVDGGMTWQVVTTSLPVAYLLLADPSSPSGLYAGLNGGGLFRTSDSGKNWRDSGTGIRTFAVNVFGSVPANASVLYAGSSNGLFQSADRGDTWNRVGRFEASGAPPPGLPTPAIPPPSAETAGVHSLLIDYSNPNILYVGTHRNSGCFFTDILLYRSMNAGGAWDDMISPKQSGCMYDDLLAIDPTDPQSLYLAYGDYYDGAWILQSSDGGSSWNNLTLSANNIAALVIDPADTKRLYAATDTGVVGTADGGQTWSTLGLTDKSVTCLVLDPLNSGTLYAGTQRGLFKSSDSGPTWLALQTGTTGPINGLVVDPQQRGVLYTATSLDGVMKSVDGGSTWFSYNAGLEYFDVRVLTLVRTDVTTIYAATPGGVFKLEEDRAIAKREIPRR